MTALSSSIAALSPEVRAVVLRLADDLHHNVSRQIAHEALAQLPIEKRGGLTLRAGRVLVADLVDAVQRMRHERERTGLRVTNQTSPLAVRRAAYAELLTADVWERNRLRNRPHVVNAAIRAVPPRPGRTDQWLVYLAKDGQAKYATRTFPQTRGGSDEMTTVAHRLFVSRRWRTEVRLVGDGSGVIAGCAILSVQPIARALGTSRTIYEAIVLRERAPGTVAVEALYVSSWPNGVETVHRTVGRALDEKVPQDIATKLSLNDAREAKSKPFKSILVLAA